ncbi:hypothetical protein O181_067056 [Austropuccinia psidii MF-1]|uniref:Secreted protein n=1 Tax=Austropuccinia psidii MF-1 TaxID=1389203 RepID=A0A9Q3ES50_9BASI|nr:hypothetical protein [Austropuccinia psidii MF-1]
MVTIGLSLNFLLPSASFIGWIITSLQSRSEVTIRWWHSGGVDRSILEGTEQIVQKHYCLPAWSWGVHSCSGMLSSSSTTKVSCAGSPLAAWLEWLHNKQAFCVCLSASIRSIGCHGGADAGDTPLSA